MSEKNPPPYFKPVTETNPYLYTGNNPVNRIDPLGLWYIDVNVSGGRWGAEATGGLIVNRRFEVVIYEDLTVLFEEEESTNPFTFLWDTSKLPPGEHLLTINLLSYDDHYGVATVPVAIAPGTR